MDLHVCLLVTVINFTMSEVMAAHITFGAVVTAVVIITVIVRLKRSRE
jgi:hypothetical protein